MGKAIILGALIGLFTIITPAHAMDPPKRARDACPMPWTGSSSRPHGFGPISAMTANVELDALEQLWAYNIFVVLGPNALDYSGSYILRRLRRDLIMGEVWVSGKFTKDAEAFPAQRGRVVLMAQKYYIYLVEGRWPYHTKVGRCRTWVQPDQPDKEFYERHDWILQNPPRPFGGGDFPHPEIADGIEPPE
jgi:hypothetical protein